MRFFEIAKTYKPLADHLPIEKLKLGIVVNTDFFDLKGIIDTLFKELNIVNYQIIKSHHPILSNNQGRILIAKQKIGEFGQIKSKYKNKLGLKSAVFLCVLDFETLINHAAILPTYKPLHPYAVIKLDLTISLNKNITYDQIKRSAFKHSKLLEKITVVSLYNNKLSLRFYFSSSKRNITEKQAQSDLNKISKSLH